jgi:phosphoglycolate phosphatase-like HAD superfamily hydrolase
MIIMPKSLILFDMDGTLIIQKERPVYTGTTTFHSSYLSIKEHMKQIVVKYGIPLHLVSGLDRMASIWNTTIRYLEDQRYPEDQIKNIITEINVPFMIEERSDYDVSILLPGTIDGLESLKQMEYELGLVTTASRESYDRISNSENYERFGRYFTYSVTRDECRYIKPEPEPINKILEYFGTSSFVYVGDSDHDAQACKTAGGDFILINTRGYDRETINEIEPNIVINSLEELPDVITRIHS